MISFIRWQRVSDVTGYNTSDATVCPVQPPYSYSLPIAPGDVLRFIANTAEFDYNIDGFYKLGLIKDCSNILYEVGTFTVNEEATQLYFSATIPSNLIESACYQLLFYEEAYPNATAWTDVSYACELGENGLRNGYQSVVQQRELGEMAYRPIAASNYLKYSLFHRSTKVVEYSDRNIGWGFDYGAFPEYKQRVRLHLTIAETGRVTSTKQYRQTNGVYRRGKTYVDKKRTLHTGLFDEPTHDALANALHHRNLLIGNEAYFLNGEYEEVHIESMATEERYHPMWKASAELLLQGYNQQNNQCALPVVEDEAGIFDMSFDSSFE